MEGFICAVFFWIKRDFHIKAVTASGNATLYLVAFLSTNNSATGLVRYKTNFKNSIRTEQQQTTCFDISIQLI